MNEIHDSKGWRLREGLRVHLLSKQGKKVKGGKVVITRVYVDDKGRAAIDYESETNLRRGTWLAEQTTLLKTTGETRCEKRYKLEKHEAALLSKAVQKKRGRL